MQKISMILLASTAIALSGCESTKQLFDPEATFAAMGQPDVKGVNDTQEQSAKDAVAAGDHVKAAQLYTILANTEKATKEQKARYRLGLAEASRRIGDYEKASALYTQLLDEDSKNLDAAEGRALTLMAQGKSVDASREFSDIVEKDGKRWRTLNALGILFTSKNMVPEAMAYYTEALKYSADNPAVLNNVGLSQAIDKNYQRSFDALDQASRLSKSPAQRKQIDMNLAMVLGASGDLERAREVAGKYYDGAALENNMGLYAHLAKNDALAKTYLNMALTQSPTYYERAWSNLDTVTQNASPSSAAPNTKLPKLKE